MNTSNELQRKGFAALIREYKIHVVPGHSFRGIKDTLIGWAIIGLMSVFVEEIRNPLILVLELNFIIMYLFGSIAILLYVLCDSILKERLKQGLKSLLISEKTDLESHSIKTHLNVKQRFFCIYSRGLLATAGFCALNVASFYFKAIDNAQIFGADALFFAIISAWLLKEKYNLEGIIGIALSFCGVIFILFNDIDGFDRTSGMVSGIAAIYSAVAFSLIFVMTSIIIRHDTPMRVTFHQCIAGLMFTIIIFLITIFIFIFNENVFYFPHVSFETLKNSAVFGVLYAIALFHFLRAFLFTRPVIIAPLGYSLPIFTTIFELFLGNITFNSINFIPSSLIMLGCGLIIREDFKEDRKKMLEKKGEVSKPIYQVDLDPSFTDYLSMEFKKQNNEISLKHMFSSIRERFNTGLIDRYEYISQRHEFNKLLLEYSHEIDKSDIESIKILPDSVVFTFTPLHIELETDGAARSAPFEVLNFKRYEPEDEYIAYNLIENGWNIIDAGSNLGWFSINFAIRFPNSQIYAFEPIISTYEVLNKNIKRNKVKNCIIFNWGLSNREGDRFFYYFKGGSAIASIENLIDHKNAVKIKCKMKTLDQVAAELCLKSIDFVKCDVEGSELFVLQGAQNILDNFKPILFIEIYDGWCRKCGYESLDIINFLKQHGYYFFEAFNHKLRRIESTRSNDEERYNYFFLHPEKHAEQIRRFS